MKTIDYSVYLDKVYGAFLGKTVVGTLGAPYEGIKMPLELPFRREMIDAMLPNDDLDLQVLWLDVVEKRGPNFTAYDLQKHFCESCKYNPGEYAIMRKNYNRGIYPPTSGRFCNDFYQNGMGCPIRSEIWACLSPLDPRLAAEYAIRDGFLDHRSDSVEAECFLAALESLAFFESDIHKIINEALDIVAEIPLFPSKNEYSKVRTLILDVVALCDKYDDIKLILRKILAKYGHTDCTNLYQNIGITLLALLKGNLDIIKTGMDALNCGFDTDCTCATAGAIIGIIRGAADLIREYDLKDVKFILEVKSDRRSDSVKDLSEDIALLGAAICGDAILNAPKKHFDFAPSQYPLLFNITYGDDAPYYSPIKDCEVSIKIKNVSDKIYEGKICIDGKNFSTKFDITIEPGGSVKKSYTIRFPKDDKAVSDRNLYNIKYLVDGKEALFTFGIAGAMPWKVTGPIWRTDPICTTEILEKEDFKYMNIIKKIKYDGSIWDITRQFHLNMAPDTETEYCTFDSLFDPYSEDAVTKYEETVFYQSEDSFRIDDFSNFDGASVFYLSRELVSPEDRTVCAQIGHSAPFELWVNGEKVACRKNCDTWTAENVHIGNIKLNKGVNKIALRLTRVNGDAKFNVTWSKGLSMAEHYVDFESLIPEYFE